MTNLSDYFDTSLLNVPYFVNSTQANYATTGNNTITVPVPEGIEEGDLIVLVGICRNSIMAAPSPGSWDELFSVDVVISSGAPVDPSTTDETLQVWSRLAGVGETGTFDTVITDISTDGQTLNCLVFRNVTTLGSYTLGGALVAASIDMLPDQILLSIHGAAYSTQTGATVAPPPSMAMTDRQYNATGDVGCAVAFQRIFTDEATGTRTWEGNWIGGSFHTITANVQIS